MNPHLAVAVCLALVFGIFLLTAWFLTPVRPPKPQEPVAPSVPLPVRRVPVQWRYCPAHGSTANGCACTRGTAS